MPCRTCFAQGGRGKLAKEDEANIHGLHGKIGEVTAERIFVLARDGWTDQDGHIWVVRRDEEQRTGVDGSRRKGGGRGGTEARCAGPSVVGRQRKPALRLADNRRP